MKTGQELYNEHLKRIETAFNLEKPDRTPICANGDIALLKYGDPKAVAADFVRRPDWAAHTVLEGILKLGGGEIDGVSSSAVNPKMSGMITLAKTKVPGRELKEDSLWQVDEIAAMTVEDYDAILDKGWAPWFDEYIFGRLGYSRDDLKEFLSVRDRATAERTEAGVVLILNGGPSATTPFNMLVGGRGLVNIARDMRKIPEKLEAVIKVITDENVATLKKQLQAGGIHAVFSGGARASGDYISEKAFERFVWPTTQVTTNTIIECGSRTWFHLDSNWESRLKYFTEFPKAKCIFDPDGLTNIFKIKEVLGDRMCITGDIPPALLSIGTKDEVYKYATTLINEIGPEGFIMSAGCCIPPNAKPENMEAVVAACLGK
ncbi:MAG: uroporphyrinogen decarboxylase family protein [Clostridiales bacterium]|jgi:uroporphyrinogen decarboxylase|nr:uroporphyrinogen-III decarboxylase [Eubacteriales bacterium]MDH7567276.1 uroporphyrinogen decarboxylase family protein [Clostridiales bacterium]